jgi:hypothetical protein
MKGLYIRRIDTNLICVLSNELAILARDTLAILLRIEVDKRIKLRNSFSIPHGLLIE